MRVSTAAVAAIVLMQLLATAGSADNGRAGVAGGSGAGGDSTSSRSLSASKYHGGYGSHHHSHSSWHVGLGYGGWGGWGGWWGWDPYWYGYYGRPWGYPVVYPDPTMRHGALDFDVSPERAEIWVDGERIGIADDFDGFPTYLWLAKGTYDVAIYLEGYRTLARQYSIYPGLVIDVEDRLEPGEAVHPSQLGPTSHERRDERLRRDREAQEEARRADESDDSWSPRSEREESFDARGEPARLRLEVAPEDASVYLDGRFLGTGRDLARLRAGLLVDPGVHTLEVVRPGFQPARRSIEVEGGGEQSLEVELESGD